VQHSNICYTGPEWREYKDNDDGKGGTNARCGIVIQDDYGMGSGGAADCSAAGKWHEGVTGMSSSVYGAGHGNAERASKESFLRKRLLRTKRLVDNMIERDHMKQLKDCKLNMDLKKVKKEQEATQETYVNDTILGEPISSLAEHEQIILKQEEEQTKSNLSLVSDKWSLKRAILLHGTSEEQEHNMPTSDASYDIEDQKSELLKRIDSSQKKASSDVYLAYIITRNAMHKLNLITMNRIVNEVMDKVYKFAAVKQGFFVKGVASKVSSNKNPNKNQQKSKIDHQVMEKQRQQNKEKQIGALGSAFIYLVCKKNGIGRTLAEICSSFEFTYKTASSESKSTQKNEVMVKPKHCSKAMTEIRQLFPKYIQSIASSTPPSKAIKTEDDQNMNSTQNLTITPQEVATTMNFVEHTCRKLKLSPIAIISIQKLVLYSKHQQTLLGIASGMKPIKLVASITLLVCDMGTIMQRLASQACKAERQNSNTGTTNSSRKRKRNAIGSSISLSTSQKKNALMPSEPKSQSSSAIIEAAVITELSGILPTDSFIDESYIPQEDEPITPNKKEATSSRSWQEWTKEKSWFRPLEKLESAFNTSKATIRDCYRKEIYPKRKNFMEELQKINNYNPSTKDDPFDHFLQTVKVDMNMKLLMNNVTVAASLMSVPRKQ